MNEIVADEFRTLNIREKLITNINEEFDKKFQFWNSGSSAVSETLKDIMATQIWIGVLSILQSGKTVAEFEKMKPSDLRIILEEKYIKSNEKESDDIIPFNQI